MADENPRGKEAVSSQRRAAPVHRISLSSLTSDEFEPFDEDFKSVASSTQEHEEAKEEGLAKPNSSPRRRDYKPSSPTTTILQASAYYQKEFQRLRRRSLELLEARNQALLEECTFAPEVCLKSIRMTSAKCGIGETKESRPLERFERHTPGPKSRKGKHAFKSGTLTIKPNTLDIAKNNGTSPERESHFKNFLDRSQAFVESMEHWRTSRKEIDRDAELEECTFTPRSGRPPRHERKGLVFDRLYDAGLKALRERDRVTSRQKELHEMEMLEGCTFAPNITRIFPMELLPFDTTPLDYSVRFNLRRALEAAIGKRKCSPRESEENLPKSRVSPRLDQGLSTSGSVVAEQGANIEDGETHHSLTV